MAKVLTFSRKFPSHCINAGEPTFFVEKIQNSLAMSLLPFFTEDVPIEFVESLSTDFYFPKHHTIRAGKRWKTGDMASLRVWSGKPYASKQIIIAPEVEVKVFDIEIDFSGEIRVDGKLVSRHDILAKNDGLIEQQMTDWLQQPKVFSGQIICWKLDHEIDYTTPEVPHVEGMDADEYNIHTM